MPQVLGVRCEGLSPPALDQSPFRTFRDVSKRR